MFNVSAMTFLRCYQGFSAGLVVCLPFLLLTVREGGENALKLLLLTLIANVIVNMGMMFTMESLIEQRDRAFRLKRL